MVTLSKKFVQTIRKKRSRVSNEHDSRAKELLPSVLPHYLGSQVRPLLTGLVKQLKQGSSKWDTIQKSLQRGKERLLSLQKRAVEILVKKEEELSEHIHYMSIWEQLYYSYLLRCLGDMTIGLKGSVEQLACSFEVQATVGLLLDIGPKKEHYSPDVLAVMAHALGTLVLLNELVRIDNPLLAEVFQQLDSQRQRETSNSPEVYRNNSQILTEKAVMHFSATLCQEITEEYSSLDSKDKTIPTDSKKEESFSSRIKGGEHIGNEESLDSMLKEKLKLSLEKKQKSSMVKVTFSRSKEDRDSGSESGMTPLHVAAHSGRYELLMCLLEEGPSALLKYKDKLKLVEESGVEHKLTFSEEQIQISTARVSSITGEIMSFQYQISSTHLRIHSDFQPIVCEMYGTVPPHSHRDLHNIPCSKQVTRDLLVANVPSNDVSTALPLECSIPSMPQPEPQFETTWCWQRRLESAPSVPQYIMNTNESDLKQLDTQCQETVFHAIASVSVPVQVSVIQHLSKKLSPSLLSVQDKHGNTPLHNAVLSRKVEVARELVNLCPSVVLVLNHDRQTPLDMAIRCGLDPVVQELLTVCVKSDPHKHSTIQMLQSFLFKGVEVGYYGYIEILLKLRKEFGLAIDFECSDGEGQTAWHHLSHAPLDVRTDVANMLRASNLKNPVLNRILMIILADVSVLPFDDLHHVDTTNPTPTPSVETCSVDDTLPASRVDGTCLKSKCLSPEPHLSDKDITDVDGVPKKDMESNSEQPLHDETDIIEINSEASNLRLTDITCQDGEQRVSSPSEAHASYNCSVLPDVHNNEDGSSTYPSGRDLSGVRGKHCEDSDMKDEEEEHQSIEPWTAKKSQLGAFSSLSRMESTCSESQPDEDRGESDSAYETKRDGQTSDEYEEPNVVEELLETMIKLYSKKQETKPQYDSQPTLSSTTTGDSSVTPPTGLIDSPMPEYGISQRVMELHGDEEPLHDEHEQVDGGIEVNPEMVPGASNVLTDITYQDGEQRVSSTPETPATDSGSILPDVHNDEEGASFHHSLGKDVSGVRENGERSDRDAKLEMELAEHVHLSRTESTCSESPPDEERSEPDSAYETKRDGLTSDGQTSDEHEDPKSKRIIEELLADMTKLNKKISYLEAKPQYDSQPTSLSSTTTEDSSDTPPTSLIDPPTLESEFTSLEEDKEIKPQPLRYQQPDTDSVTPSHNESEPHFELSVPTSRKEQRKRTKSRIYKYRELTTSGSDGGKQQLKRRPLRSKQSLRRRHNSGSHSEYETTAYESSDSSKSHSSIQELIRDDSPKRFESGQLASQQQFQLRKGAKSTHRARVQQSYKQRQNILVIDKYFTVKGRLRTKEFSECVVSRISKHGYHRLRCIITPQWFPIFGLTQLRRRNLTQKERKVARAVCDVVRHKRDSVPLDILENLDALDSLLTSKYESQEGDLERGKKRFSKSAKAQPAKSSASANAAAKPHPPDEEKEKPHLHNEERGKRRLHNEVREDRVENERKQGASAIAADGAVASPSPVESHHQLNWSFKPSAASNIQEASNIQTASWTPSTECREEASTGLSVLEYCNSSNPLNIIHHHLKTYEKCCPRHDITQIVTICNTAPASDAFGPKRRYASIKDIKSQPNHSEFECTKQLSAQSSKNRHYREGESHQIMFERLTADAGENRGALPPNLIPRLQPISSQQVHTDTQTHSTFLHSSKQHTQTQLSTSHRDRANESTAVVATAVEAEDRSLPSEPARESARRIETQEARTIAPSELSRVSLLDRLTIPEDHKMVVQSLSELLHAQDYNRILQLAFEGEPPTNLPLEAGIPYVFITGLAYYKLSNHKKSVQHFTRCLRMADEAGRDGDITICNIYIGDIEFAKRKYSEAAGRYRTALQHYSRHSVAQEFKMVMPTQSAVWLKSGSAFKNASRVGDSVSAYEKAIELATTNSSKKDQLSARTSLGNLYQGIGENGRAVKEYEEAIKLAEELGDHVSLGWNHGNLGNALLGLHLRDKALYHLDLALDMAVKYEMTPQAIGRAYNNLGTAFQSLNELSKAEEQYDLALAQAIYGNDIPGQARVYGNIGNLQMLNKRYERAVPHYTEVMRLSQDKATITTAHHNRGCAYYDWAVKKMNDDRTNQRGRTTAIEIKGGNKHSSNSSSSSSSSSNQTNTSNGHFTVSLHGPNFEDCEEVYRPRKVKEAIQKYYLQGTRDLEYVIKHHEESFNGVKGSPKGLSLSVSLFETNSRTFHRMQDCHVHLTKNGDDPAVKRKINPPTKFEDALVVAEQSRARTLGELMLKRRGGQLMHELVSPPTLDQMKTIVGRQTCPVVYLSYTGERVLGWLLYPSPKGGASVNMFEIPLSDNEFDGKSLDYHLRYALNEQLVEKSFEMYKPFDHEKDKTEPLEKLYDLVARPIMLMLQTIEKKQEGQKTEKDKVKYLYHSSLRSSLDTERDGVGRLVHNRKKPKRDDQSHDERPKSKKKEVRKIVVVPDSYTNLLPFTCVLNKDTGEFWGDEFYFQIMPSLLTMGILDQLPTVSVNIPVQYQQMLCVVGNPTIPRFKYNNEEWDLGKLPHATREAEWVSHILQCNPILHEQATKDAVLMRIMNARVIHLATHGSAVAGFLAFAGMTSSSGDAVEAKRVLIYPEEVESLNISPALVVLSSCDSGRGVFKADGIQGMARAFILAGAQAVLTALWRVPDESACIFMQFFYQYLVEGMRGTEALHKAILCLRCFSKYSQYIHWSGYQLTGREFQFSVNESLSRAQLALRLGYSSVFPRLEILKDLEKAFLKNPRLPTDVQVLHAPPGVKPSEPLKDFIHCHHAHFSGGIFWINCRSPQLIDASLTSIKNALELDELTELGFSESEPTLVVLYYLEDFPKEDCPLLRLLKHSSVHIVVVSKIASPDQLRKSADNQLIRGTKITNIQPLTTIHATQRLVHSTLQNHHLTPSKREQVLFERLAEFTTGSPPIIDLTTSLLNQSLEAAVDSTAEEALENFAEEVKLVELPQQKPHSVPREFSSFQPQDSFLNTRLRCISREVYDTVTRDREEDVFRTSAKYDSWQVVTVLIERCRLSSEEKLLLYCLATFNCCPIPTSYVTELCTLITKASHKPHLASTLHQKLQETKMLKIYPKPLIHHPKFTQSATSSEDVDDNFVYVPRFISAAVFKDMMTDIDKVMALTTCYKALSISLSQPSTPMEKCHLLGVGSILIENFELNFRLVGRECFQAVYSLLINTERP